ncbi:MAG: response regulator [Pseudomonadota bacterium]
MKKVLIVDDSMMSRMMMKRCMPPVDQYQYELKEASGGKQCLEMYKSAPFDLIFLDLTMPEMDGFETLEELRKMDPNAKVVVATADIQQKAQEKVISLGALEVIKKPPTKELITAAIQKYL